MEEDVQVEHESRKHKGTGGCQAGQTQSWSPAGEFRCQRGKSRCRDWPVGLMGRAASVEGLVYLSREPGQSPQSSATAIQRLGRRGRKRTLPMTPDAL